MVAEDQAVRDRVLAGLDRAEIEAAVDSFTEDEKNEAYVRLLADQDREYAKDLWLWLSEEVITQDEASGQALPWPKDKVYLQEAAYVLKTEPLIAMPKTRRMLATWLVAAHCTHQVRYFPHKAVFFQSEKEEKAAFVVDKRCVFLEDNLRNPYLRRRYSGIKTGDGLIGRLTYARTESYILAIAQGDSQLRTYTPSILVMDESDFQPEGPEALTAALPAIEQGKGSQLIVISSSNGPGGVLAGLCKPIGFTRFPA